MIVLLVEGFEDPLAVRLAGLGEAALEMLAALLRLPAMKVPAIYLVS